MFISITSTPTSCLYWSLLSLLSLALSVNQTEFLGRYGHQSAHGASGSPRAGKPTGSATPHLSLPFSRDPLPLPHPHDGTLLYNTAQSSGILKAGLKLNIQKTRIVASGPITSWQIEGENWKQWQILFSWAPKSLCKVTAAMKLKDACCLEGKL